MGTENEDAYDAWLGTSARSADGIEELMQEPLFSLSLERAVSVQASASLRDVVETMREQRIGCVPVLDGERLVGIFTERDVLVRVVGRTDLDAPVRGYMTADPVCVQAGERLVNAMARMLEGRYRHLPVLDGDRLVGVFGMRRAMRCVLEAHENVLLTAPPPGTRYAATAEGA